jgi:ABC-type bacteriocin/lantibiotic exporter with double-glycine peptidase domain
MFLHKLRNAHKKAPSSDLFASSKEGALGLSADALHVDLYYALSYVAHYYFGETDFSHVTSFNERESREEILTQLVTQFQLDVCKIEIDQALLGELTSPVLLARESDQKLFVAFPRSRGRYHLLDPTTGELVSPREASHIKFEEVGHCFFEILHFKTAPSFFGLVKLVCHRASSSFLGIFISVFVVSMLGLLTPVLSSHIINDAIPEASLSLLIQFSLILLCAGIGIGLFTLIKDLALIRLIARSTVNFQSSFIALFMRLKLASLKKYSPGDLVARLLGASTFFSAVMKLLSNFMHMFVFAIVSFLIMLYFAWKLALVVLGCLIVYAIIYSILTVFQRQYLLAAENQFGQSFGESRRVISAVNTIKAFGLESLFVNRWLSGYKKSRHEEYRYYVFSVFKGIINYSGVLIIMGFVFAAVNWLYDGHINLGYYIGFNAALLQTYAAVSGLMSLLDDYVQAKVTYQRLLPVMSASVETMSTKHVVSFSGGISAHAIKFRYHASRSLIKKPLSFTLQPNQLLVISGEMGSGKSTLIRLLAGRHVVTAGSILLDDVDIAELNQQQIESDITLVGDQAYLLSGLLISNLISNDKLNLDDVWRVTKQLGFEADITSLPMKFYTYLSEDAGNISSSLNLKLLLIRAFLRQTPYLFIDDIAALFDEETFTRFIKVLLSHTATRVIVSSDSRLIEAADVHINLDEI